MNLNEWRGSWAVVTGSSSGIGREFAAQLAERGLNLALVARREAVLASIAAELEGRHRINARVYAIDLSVTGAARTLGNRLASDGIRVRLLCNCAAFGQWGHFEIADAARYEQMLLVNAAAAVALCRTFLPDLSAHDGAAVINVSSPAALQPVPYMAVYAASKAFAQSFSLALYEEWRERRIHVQTLLPGPTATEFDSVAGAYASAIGGRATPGSVVTASLAALASERPLVVPARGYWKQRLFASVAPTRQMLRMVARMFKPPD